MPNPKPKKPVDPNDDSIETGRLENQSPRPVAAADVHPFTVDPLDPVHELDTCPVNAKIVVTETGAYLATPGDGKASMGTLRKLAWDTVGGVLPVGTKIYKLTPAQYRGVLPAESGGNTVVFDNTNDVLRHLREIIVNG